MAFIAHNKAGERLDGLSLGVGVKFIGKAHQSLTHVGFEYAEGFAVADWQSVCDSMLALRERLRLTSV